MLLIVLVDEGSRFVSVPDVVSEVASLTVVTVVWGASLVLIVNIASTLRELAPVVIVDGDVLLTDSIAVSVSPPALFNVEVIVVTGPFLVLC